MKKVLIVQGGWDGHEPQLTSKRFAGLMAKNGYEVEISDTLDCLADAEALKELDLIVACWTMGAIRHEYVETLSARTRNGSLSPAASGSAIRVETAFPIR